MNAVEVNPPEQPRRVVVVATIDGISVRREYEGYELVGVVRAEQELGRKAERVEVGEQVTSITIVGGPASGAGGTGGSVKTMFRVETMARELHKKWIDDRVKWEAASGVVKEAWREIARRAWEIADEGKL